MHRQAGGHWAAAVIMTCTQRDVEGMDGEGGYAPSVPQHLCTAFPGTLPLCQKQQHLDGVTTP